MEIDEQLFSLLEQYHFLRGRLRKRLAEKNPVQLAYFTFPKDEEWLGEDVFLTRFTPEQVAKSAEWSCALASFQQRRFPLGEATIRKDSYYWPLYLRHLMLGWKVPPAEQLWAKEEYLKSHPDRG